MGVFCVLALYGWVSFILGAGADILDPGDFLLEADPDIGSICHDVLTAVLLAPIFEEPMFRGVLFVGLMKRIRAVPAALFAVIHTQHDPWGLLSVGVMGLGACWLVWRTGSIKSGIVLRAIYNLLITLEVYLLYQLPN